MQFFSAQPSPLLAPYVKNYWAMENCLPQGKVYHHRIIPTGLPDLSFYLHNRPFISETGKSFESASTLTGQQKNYYNLSLTGRTTLFSVTFRPSGLAAFFPLPAKELFSLHVPLQQILATDVVRKMEDQLFEASTFIERVKIAEDFLIRLLRKNTNDYPGKRIMASIERVNKSTGHITVDQLAKEACYSRKQFERVFAAKAGISPGQFLRVVRFQHALHLGVGGYKQNLTQLSYHAGYYDQAHMINEFQKLSGLTPSEFFKNDCAPYSDYFGDMS